MTLRHLKIFIAVCENGGITRAAEALHITQPAISHTISELEKYYHVTLFDRINQRLVLTDTGKEVLSRAKEIVDGFEEFEAFVSGDSKNPRVRIGCSLTLGQTVIPSFMHTVRERYPHIEPKIMIDSSAAIIEEMECGNLDFALIEGDVTSPYLLAEPFKTDRIIAVANALFEVPDRLTAQQLAHYPLMVRKRGSASRELLEQLAAKHRLHLKLVIESNNNQAIVAALYASVGLALLPESYVSGHIERGKFKELTIEGFDGQRVNHLIMHKNKRLNAAGREAYKILKEI